MSPLQDRIVVPITPPARLGTLRASFAFRLALLYGLAVIAVMLVVSVMFYVGTVGVLARGIDDQLTTLSTRLTDLARSQGEPAVAEEIGRLLSDGIASDTEVYLLSRPNGERIVGNVLPWPWDKRRFGRLDDQPVLRLGRPSIARVLPVWLPGGDVLVVGRDMPDQREIRRLVWRALGTSGLVTVMMATLGALLFHRRIDQRLSAIRDTAARIESGELDWRVPPADRGDEFSRLNTDINHMLDHIQHLMGGVRHVSNAIAHDLRTPLGRVRGRLDEALRAGDPVRLAEAARDAIAGIDQLIQLFERLLQIAEAESGTRRQSFVPVALAEMLATIGELFDAMAEEKGFLLTVSAPEEAVALGDRALLSAMLANLVENAFKYAAGPSPAIALSLAVRPGEAELVVTDNGPGIPEAERDKVLGRFYRLDQSRSQPGNGLGLSLVAAIAALHGGRVVLEDATPGLGVRVILPLPVGNLSKP